MRLSVKVLGGQECCVDAKDDYTVEQLKADIESKLKLGKTEQKLLFKGKTLQGNYTLKICWFHSRTITSEIVYWIAVKVFIVLHTYVLSP